MTPKKALSKEAINLETGRIRFRRVQFQTPISVSFFWPHRVPGQNSVSSSQPNICVPKRTHRVFSQNSPSLPQNSVTLSEFSPLRQYSRNSIPPVSYKSILHLGLELFSEIPIFWCMGPKGRFWKNQAEGRWTIAGRILTTSVHVWRLFQCSFFLLCYF